MTIGLGIYSILSPTLGQRHHTEKDHYTHCHYRINRFILNRNPKWLVNIRHRVICNDMADYLLRIGLQTCGCLHPSICWFTLEWHGCAYTWSTGGNSLGMVIRSFIRVATRWLYRRSSGDSGWQPLDKTGL